MEKSAQPPVWLWLNVLSLDAPLIALVWQDFVARSYPAALFLPGRITLALTVWCVYLADKLLDSQYPSSQEETPRHLFSRQHIRLTQAGLTSALAADALITLLFLRGPVIRGGLVLAAGVGGYLAFFPWKRLPAVVWKKMSAAGFFTTGIFLVAWTRTRHPGMTLTAPAIALFAVLLANLLFIETWESGEATFHGWVWMGALLLGCLSFHGMPWFRAVAVSATGLGLLDVFGKHMKNSTRCTLADAALLAPLLFW